MEGLNTSNLTKIKTKIKNANMQLLAKAVEALIKQRGATAVTKVRDYSGREQTVELGLKDSTFTRGIGFTIENGEVKLVGDTWQISPSHVTELQNQLNQHYTHQAVTSTFTQLGYQVVSNKVKEDIYIKAYAFS